MATNENRSPVAPDEKLPGTPPGPHGEGERGSSAFTGNDTVDAAGNPKGDLPAEGPARGVQYHREDQRQATATGATGSTREAASKAGDIADTDNDLPYVGDVETNPTTPQVTGVPEGEPTGDDDAGSWS